MNISFFNRAVFVLITLLLFTPSYGDEVWIDVRTSVEHTLDNIEGDIRISHGDIVEEVSKRFPDKSTEIRLYCRSGGRAGKAITALKNAGYINVRNDGGIEDARRTRGIQP